MTPQLPSVPVTAQRPAEAPRTLPRDSGPFGLYAGAVRHLAGRTAVLLSTAALRLGRWATAPGQNQHRPGSGPSAGLCSYCVQPWPCPDAPSTARDRAVDAGHPSTRARLAVVPDGYAQGRADLQLTHSPFACLGVDCAAHRKDS